MLKRKKSMTKWTKNKIVKAYLEVPPIKNQNFMEDQQEMEYYHMKEQLENSGIHQMNQQKKQEKSFYTEEKTVFHPKVK